MQLLCLGTIALNNRPFRLPVWETPRDFAPGPGARLLFDWARPLSEPLTFSPRRTGPLGGWSGPDSGQHKWSPAIVSLAGLHAPAVRQEQAATSTQLMLQQAGFKTLGAGLTPEEAARPLLWGTADGELTILDWTFSQPADSGAEGSPNGWPGLLEAGRLIQAVRQTSDWVMVVMHWDDSPFPHPLPAHRELARQLSQLGADIVIGQHPAGVRGMEFVDTRPVFYGLGTFYSSEPQQDGSEPVYDPLRGRSSLGVRFTFQHGRPPVYDLFSFWSDQNEVCLDHAQRAFRRMNSTSISLHDHPDSVYEEWYTRERDHTDKWERRLRLESLRRDLTRRLRKLA